MSYRPHFTPDEWIAALNDEISMRWRVYPSLVRSGKMKQEESNRKIAVITDLRDALVHRHAKKSPPPKPPPNPPFSQPNLITMSKAPTSTADTVSSNLITSRVHLDEAMAQLQALHTQRNAEQAKLDKKLAAATAKHQDALNGFDADIHLYHSAIEEYALEQSESLLHGLKTKTIKLAAGELKFCQRPSLRPAGRQGRRSRRAATRRRPGRSRQGQRVDRQNEHRQTRPPAPSRVRSSNPP